MRYSMIFASALLALPLWAKEIVVGPTFPHRRARHTAGDQAARRSR